MTHERPRARPARPLPPVKSRRSSQEGHFYFPGFVSAEESRAALEWLATLSPLWERRHRNDDRWLLRPVYWLGSWQFACLDYYRPPHGIRERCVRAEPFPRVLRELVARAERLARERFRPPDLPAGWRLNTCLVNFYGSRHEGGRWIDAARVGEHRDFEPGPVASLSLGERARFQFVRRGFMDAPPVRTQWLEDNSLQIFGGPHWKDDLLHRVQRVENKQDLELPPAIAGFRTRRINFTFRYVPDEHVTPFAQLPAAAREDVRDYIATLAESSAFWKRAL